MNGAEAMTLAAALIAAAAAIWSTRDTRKGNRDTRQIKNQVVNGHSTNLRDEMDGVIGDIREMRRDISGLREDIGGLRGELRDEREARIESDRAVITQLRKPAR